MTKQLLLADPSIIALQARYEAEGEPFDTMLDICLDQAMKQSTNEYVIISKVIQFLNEWLDQRPAKTRGGRILRGIMKVLKMIWK